MELNIEFSEKNETEELIEKVSQNYKQIINNLLENENMYLKLQNLNPKPKRKILSNILKATSIVLAVFGSYKFSDNLTEGLIIGGGALLTALGSKITSNKEKLYSELENAPYEIKKTSLETSISINESENKILKNQTEQLYNSIDNLIDENVDKRIIDTKYIKKQITNHLNQYKRKMESITEPKITTNISKHELYTN